MKKITLVVARSEISDVLQALADLGCLELSEPDAVLGTAAVAGVSAADSEILGLAELRKVDAGFLGANKEELPLLETPHTCILTGWVPARSAPELEYQMGRFTAAWEIGDLSPDEAVLAPVKLSCPVLFGKMRLAGRKRFDPLVKKYGGEREWA